MSFKLFRFNVLLILLVLQLTNCTNKTPRNNQFGAYYTNIESKNNITGKYADIVVKIGDNKEFVFPGTKQEDNIELKAMTIANIEGITITGQISPSQIIGQDKHNIRLIAFLWKDHKPKACKKNQQQVFQPERKKTVIHFYLLFLYSSKCPAISAVS